MTLPTSSEDDAEKWLSLHLSGEISDAQQARFQSWLRESEDHRRAYDRVARLWDEIEWDETLNEEALRSPSPPYAHRHTPLSSHIGKYATAGLAAMAACFSLAFLNLTPSQTDTVSAFSFRPPPAELYETGLGEIRTLTLEDGSEITLAARSRMEVSLSDKERMAKLIEGDGYFKISPDAHRPFSVETDQLNVRVLGTEFEINSKSGHGLISVVEGSVEVTTPDRLQKAILKGGQRAFVARETGLKTEDFDPSRIAGWREMRLSFLNSTLGELITEVNRYHEGGVYLASPDLHDRKVSTSFRTDQVEMAISGIALSMNLDTIRTENGAIILRHTAGHK